MNRLNRRRHPSQREVPMYIPAVGLRVRDPLHEGQMLTVTFINFDRQELALAPGNSLRTEPRVPFELFFKLWEMS